MKKFILALLLAFSATIMLPPLESKASITDIQFSWFGQLQDISETSDIAIFNLSTIYMEDGSYHEATESDAITWVWSRMHQQGNGIWNRQVIDTAFQLTPSQYMDFFCNGIFVIEVQAIEDATGIKRAAQGPCRILWNNAVIAECPELITSVPNSSYNDTNWLNNDQKHRTMGRDVAYRQTGPQHPFKADLDEDLDVDVTDLLLFNIQYGSSYSSPGESE